MKRGFSSTGALCFLVILLLLVVAAIWGLKLARNASFGREAGTTLVFAPDSKDFPDKIDLDITVDALKCRINTGWWSSAQIRLIRVNRGPGIEIGIYGTNADDARRIQELVERMGTLEFRVLANDRDHKELIDRAKKAKATVVRAEKKDDSGEYPVIAEWVSLDGSERFKDKAKREAASAKLNETARARAARDEKRVAALLSYPEICKRTFVRGNKEIDQILVFRGDSQNVTHLYLVETSAGIDAQGRPCVNFRFNKEGAARFAALTGNNLPEQDGTFSRKLGIIIDGCLYSAPSIQSTISDRGEITGDFTREEVEDLVRVLNSGTLPVKLRLVEKR